MLKKLSEIIFGDEAVREARHTIKGLKGAADNRGHIRDREIRKLNEARVTTRRHMVRVLSASSALIVASGLAGVSLWPKREMPNVTGNVPPPDSFPKQEIPQLGPDRIQALIQYQQERKRWTINALEQFKDTNDRTRQLFEMLKKHAFYTIPLGPLVTQQIIPGDQYANSFIDPLNDKYAFEIVFMPEEFAKTLSSSVVWGQGSERTLRIAAEIENPNWFAAVVYHELGHVWDALWEEENPQDPAQWTDGEVRAHEVECEVLQTWKPVEYAEFLRQAAPYWRTRNLGAIVALGSRLFPSPGKSKRAQALASGALTACAAFEAARQDGKDLNMVYREEILPTHQSYIH